MDQDFGLQAIPLSCISEHAARGIALEAQPVRASCETAAAAPSRENRKRTWGLRRTVGPLQIPRPLPNAWSGLS